MTNPQSNKPTVWILDDQWRSALTKISWFFNFTEASFPASSSPDTLKSLDQSASASGWQLKSLSPDALMSEPLRNGIVLLDVNWSAAPETETVLAGLSPSEKEHYGITLSEELLARRSPGDNLEVVLFSHTKGSRLTDYYVSLAQRGVERVRPVVILDESEDGPLIRSYGREACDRVTAHLLRQIPGADRKVTADKINQRLGEPDFVRPEDFTTGIEDQIVDGIRVRDLAVPFYKQVEAAEASAPVDDAQRAGMEPLRRWNDLLQSQRIAFDLQDDLSNLPASLLRALFRYGKVDHLDGFMFLRDVSGSRYAGPVEALKRTLERSKTPPENATLGNSFTRIVSVGLGTPIRKLADGEPIEELSTAFRSLPPALQDPAVFDVEGRSHTPEAKLSVFSGTGTAFRIKIADDVIWDNRLIHAAQQIRRFQTGDASRPESLLDILETDPGNLQTCLEIAKHAEALRAAVPKSDSRWELVRDAFQEQIFALKRAADALEAYCDFLQTVVGTFETGGQDAFAKDIRGSNEREKQWDAWRESLEPLLAALEPKETLGSRLLGALDAADSTEGEIELENLLSPFFARVRGYANKTLQKTLQRRGIDDEAHRKPIDGAFAELFPRGDPDAIRNNWTSIATVALGTGRIDLAASSDATLERKIVQAMGTELVEKITGLKGYAFLERSELLHDEEQ